MTATFPIHQAGGPQKAGQPQIVPAILCGGSGSRLWPVSRRDFAKQHVPILDGPSPFQRTLSRLDPQVFATPLVISGAGAQFMVADQASSLGIAVDIALEPEGRDTLAAVTLAACLVARRDPEAILLVLPSDHLIPDAGSFHASVTEAARLAEDGHIVLIGLAATGPAPGFGYIAPGAALTPSAHTVARFIEKPEADHAARLVADGWLWNSGIFCFRASAALAEIERHAPESLIAVRKALETASVDLGALRLGADFAAAPKTSFDRAVLEHTDRAAVVRADLAWSDLGDWKGIWDQSPKDAHGVAREGRVHAHDVTDSYLRSDGRLVCALGVSGLAVIDTVDAVLVAPLDRAQEIKAMVQDLETARMPEARSPARVHRPWGWYQTMDLGERFRVKRIMVKPGKKLSLQRHHHRAEHWVVVRGTAEVTRDHEVLLLRENESVYLPLGCVHRLANPGKIPVEIVEVQTGAYLEEDDIVRLEDDFGRV